MASEDWAFESLLRARRDFLRQKLGGRTEVTPVEAFRVLTGREDMNVAQSALIATILAGIARPVAEDTWSLV